MSDRLDDEIQAIVRTFKGVLGVAAIDLSAGAPRQIVAVNADLRFPTASTIKTAVMLEAYHQAAEGTLSFDTPLTCDSSDKVGGSGVLRDLHDGLTLTVADAVQLMIALSDNTATNLLIARLGTASVNARLDTYGLTRHAPLPPDVPRRPAGRAAGSRTRVRPRHDHAARHGEADGAHRHRAAPSARMPRTRCWRRCGASRIAR